MAECNPPEPPPLLREPYTPLPTAAEIQAQRHRSENERLKRDLVIGTIFGADDTSEGPPWGCGCLILIAIPMLAAVSLAMPVHPHDLLVINAIVASALAS